MPLYAYYDQGSWSAISTAMLTATLQHSVTVLGQAYRVQPTDISIRSLRSSGAMALLCVNVDTDHIRKQPS
jgi:hypothetical protein